MPQHKSAKKRVRSNEKKRIQNKRYISTVKSAVKEFRVAVGQMVEGKIEVGPVKTLLSTAQKMLSKATAKGMIPKNTSSRRIGRLAKFFDKNEKLAGAGEAPKKVTKKKATKKKVTKKKTTKKKATKKK